MEDYMKAPNSYFGRNKMHLIKKCGIGLAMAVIGLSMTVTSLHSQAGTNRNTHWKMVSVFSPSPSILDFPYQQALIAFKRNIEASTNITVDII